MAKNLLTSFFGSLRSPFCRPRDPPPEAFASFVSPIDRCRVGRRFSLKITRLENDEKLFLYLKKAGLKVSSKLPPVFTIESPDDSEDELTDDDEVEDDDVVFKKPTLVDRVKTSTPKRIVPVKSF